MTYLHTPRSEVIFNSSVIKKKSIVGNRVLEEKTKKYWTGKMKQFKGD
jgi:hypothetical protein